MPGKKVKLAGSLPVGEANGLREFAGRFLDDPAAPRLAVVVLDSVGVAENFDRGEVTAVVRVRRVELIGDVGDANAAKRLMMRANEARTGKTVLPLDLESDIDSVFEAFAQPPKPTKGKGKSEEDGDQ